MVYWTLYLIGLVLVGASLFGQVPADTPATPAQVGKARMLIFAVAIGLWVLAELITK